MRSSAQASRYVECARRTRAKRSFAQTDAAGLAGIPMLAAEVESARQSLDAPAARLVARGEERTIRLEEVESLLASDALVIDACRYALRTGGAMVSLATRPVLLLVARTLAEAWPGEAMREALVARTFRGKVADESYRVRLRVEIGRLRTLLRPMADIIATKSGFVLVPRHARDVVVLARQVEERHAALLALLADGETWQTSALALATGVSQRNVQRALEALAAQGKVQAVGRGRARRWMTPPMPGFATTLLLALALPGD
jgi:hypothetical protein